MTRPHRTNLPAPVAAFRRGLSEIAYQVHVARPGGADDDERAPAGREVEGESVAGLQAGQLPGLSPVEGLRPDVGDAAGAVRVGD